MVTYMDRINCRHTVMVNGGLLSKRRAGVPTMLNHAFCQSLKREGKILLHLIDLCPDLSADMPVAEYLGRLAFLEASMDRYGLSIASLRISVYNPSVGQNLVEQTRYHLHAALRWPQKYLSVVYDHYHYDLTYMLAVNSSENAIETAPFFGQVYDNDGNTIILTETMSECNPGQGVFLPHLEENRYREWITGDGRRFVPQRATIEPLSPKQVTVWVCAAP